MLWSYLRRQSLRIRNMVMNKNQVSNAKQFEKLAEIEKYIQSGQLAVAINTISTLNRVSKGKIPRELLYRLSNLARRAGAPLLASRILAPLFRTDGVDMFPTASERAAYGACLSTLGANQEAERVFSQ